MDRTEGRARIFFNSINVTLAVTTSPMTLSTTTPAIRISSAFAVRMMTPYSFEPSERFETSNLELSVSPASNSPCNAGSSRALSASVSFRVVEQLSPNSATPRTIAAFQGVLRSGEDDWFARFGRWLMRTSIANLSRSHNGHVNSVRNAITNVQRPMMNVQVVPATSPFGIERSALDISFFSL